LDKNPDGRFAGRSTTSKCRRETIVRRTMDDTVNGGTMISHF